MYVHTYVCVIVSGVKHVSSFLSFLCTMYILHTHIIFKMRFKCSFNNILILLFHDIIYIIYIMKKNILPFFLGMGGAGFSATVLHLRI